jgi:hypothetical protein
MLDERTGLQGVLACRAVSATEAVRRLDRAERTYERFVRRVSGKASITACARLIAEWAHRHVDLLPEDRYGALLQRLCARDPHESARRMFRQGTLSAVTRFVRQVDPVPPPLAEGWAMDPQFQPMAELRVLDPADGVLAAVGIDADDRLFVHIGSVAYRGAVVLASCEADGGIRHFAARVLEFETGEHGHLMRIAEGADGLMLAQSGVVRVECVIFNRPDVLWSAGGSDAAQ